MLRASAAQKYDAVLVLGDLVGYGADPNAVVDRVRDLEPVAIVRGNHDKVAAGLDNAEDFNPMAKAAAHWTREALTPSTLEYLRDLPVGPLSSMTMWKSATARRSTKISTWWPISTPRDRLRSRTPPICLFGHTHVALSRTNGRPAAGSRSKRRKAIRNSRPRIDADSKYLINPGLGRPAARRRRPRGYAIADTDGRS